MFVSVSMILSSLIQVKGYNDHFTTFTSYEYKGITRKSYTSNVGRNVGAKDHLTCFYNDGSWLYCIENGQKLTHASSFDKVDNIDSFLQEIIHHKTTAAQKQKWLSVLMGLVPHSYTGDATKLGQETYIRYSAIATIIWEIMDECRDKDFRYIGADSGKTAPKDGNIYTTDAIRTQFYQYYNEYIKGVENFFKVPSFTSTTQASAPVHHLTYNSQTKQYEILLKDSQNVLEHYDFYGEDCQFEKNGNEIKISTTKRIQNGETLMISLKDGKEHRQSALVGFQPSDSSHQKLMCAGELVAPQTRAYLQLKMDFGSLRLKKIDSFDTLIDGAIFHLTNHQDVNTDLVVKNGELTVEQLNPGIYELYEVKAPQGYLLDSEKYSVKIESNQVTQKTIVNQEPWGKIELKKTIDSHLTQGMLGDVFVSDITYGLYAKEDIENVTHSHKYYTKDQCISSLLTNQSGLIVWDKLPMGRYYIKELQTNSSLLLNPTIIDVELTYSNMNTAVVKVPVTTEDVVASRRIQIFKEGIKDGQSGIVQGLKGAQFTFVLNSDFEKVGFEKSHVYYQGETDEDGFLTTPLLPYGVYRVRETKTPEGYYGASDFLITIDKDYSFYDVPHQIKKVTVNNVPFESLLKIVKKDKETGKTVEVAGATFKIKNLDTQEYVSYIDWSSFPQIHINQWTTHEDGTITLNTKLKKGHYALEEVSAPNGYMLNVDKVMFEIDEQNYDIATDGVTPITVVEFYDEPIHGQVSISKLGEGLVGFQDGQFVYRKEALQGVTFGIYASDDILSASHHSLLYKKGECVAQIVTDEKGVAVSPLLPLGAYEYKELHTVDGFVLDDKAYPFLLEQENQMVSIVKKNFEIENNREKISVKVCKKDKDTQAFVEGALLSLITNQDIYNHKGEKIVVANTVFQTVKSSKDGYVVFDIDLPVYAFNQSLYHVEETQQPDGYVKTDLTYDISFCNDEDNEHQFDFYNQKTVTEILKVDCETLTPLSGAYLQVIDPVTNKVIDEWESTQESHIIQGLIMDKQYLLHEVKAPDGYMLSEDLLFIMNYPEKRIQFSNEKEPVETLGDEPPVTDDMISITPLLAMLLTSIATLIILGYKKKKVS